MHFRSCFFTLRIQPEQPVVLWFCAVVLYFKFFFNFFYEKKKKRIKV